MDSNVPALEVAGLEKTFFSRKKAPVHAVRGISFTVSQREVVGLLGPNGAGKTTTIKCILGLMNPTAGEVRVMGYDLKTEYRKLVRSTCAVLEGSRNIYWRMTPRENLDFFTGLYGIPLEKSRPYSEHLLRVFRLEEKRHALVQELSSGMKQKVAVACALASRSPLVFLDEPTLGLDVETSYELRETLKQLAKDEGRAIVVSSHDMDVIQDVCSRVIIIKQGSIIVDDQLENLLQLFRTRAYRFTLSNGHAVDLEQAVVAHFPGTTVSRAADRTVLEVILPRAGDLYRFVDLVRESGLFIAGINQKEPDLEEAFLQLVRKGA
ncbi:MAG: ABC transporter ATP-binding protein [Bacillota bacterium]